MKQLVASFSFIASALALAGCASDEFVGQNTDRDIITFNVNADNQTRAASSYCAVNMPPHFHVWADYESDSGKTLYIDGDKVNKKDGDNYQSEELRYWPMNIPTMSFYAYVDAIYVSGTGESATEINSFKYTKTGSPVFENYKVNDDVAKQKDLMYAVALNSATGKAVSLNFRHALSQVCFKASNENPNIKITIKEVSVHNVKGEGTYSFPSASTEKNYTIHDEGASANDNATDLNHGSWNSTSSEANQSYTVKLGEGDGGVTLTTPAKDSQITTDDNLTAPEAHTDISKVMILLPQHAQPASLGAEGKPTGNGVYFALKLKIENVATGTDGVSNLETVISEGEYYAFPTIEWEEGYRYTYIFRFSPKWNPLGTTTIDYDATADDFIPGQGDITEDDKPETPPSNEVVLVPETDDLPAIIFADRNVGSNVGSEQ